MKLNSGGTICKSTSDFNAANKSATILAKRHETMHDYHTILTVDIRPHLPLNNVFSDVAFTHPQHPTVTPRPGINISFGEGEARTSSYSLIAP